MRLGALVNPGQSVTLMHRWNTELADFYLRRLQQCAVLPFELAQCQAPDEFVQVQKSFYGQFMDDCAKEAERLTDIIAEQASEAAATDGGRADGSGRVGDTAGREAASVATGMPGTGPAGKGGSPSSKAARSA